MCSRLFNDSKPDDSKCTFCVPFYPNSLSSFANSVDPDQLASDKAAFIKKNFYKEVSDYC